MIEYPNIAAPPEVFRVDHNNGLTLGSRDLLDSDPRGIVWIWEPPRPSGVYVLGADPAAGITGWNRTLRTRDDEKIDNAAIEVIRKGEKGGPDVQVAEYAAPIDPYDLAPVINVLGRLYGGSDDDGQALAIIEVWPGPGLSTQRELWEKFGYTNIFVWKYLDRPGMYQTTSYGWTASSKSVRDLWIKGVRHTVMGGVEVYSPWLTEEMANCENDPDKMRGAAIYGYHDDRVSAYLLALWALHDWTGQVANVSTGKVEITTQMPDWQRSDISYEAMMERWNDMVEEMLE